MKTRIKNLKLALKFLMPWDMQVYKIIKIDNDYIYYKNTNKEIEKIYIKDLFFYCKDYANIRGYQIFSTNGEAYVKEYKHFYDEFYIKNDFYSEIECVIICALWIKASNETNS